MATPQTEQYGLRWERDFLSWAPEWDVEPDTAAIERIARRVLGLSGTAMCSAMFLASGAVNRVYTITTDKEPVVFRVALPVDPNKVASEVSTMVWVQKTTDIPIPRPVAYDNSASNELRFPWIMMQYASGQTLFSRWRKMSFERKRVSVQDLANYQAQLYRGRSTHIGSLGGVRSPGEIRCDPVYHSNLAHLFGFSALLALSSSWAAIGWLGYLIWRSIARNGPACPSQFLGRITAYDYWIDPATPEAPSLGPYANSHDWLYSRLMRVIARNDEAIAEARSEGAEEDDEAEKRKASANGLLGILPRLFPATATETGTILFHKDLNDGNILVDDSGRITAILDWEFLHTVPLWYGTTFPKLLRGYKRIIEPQRDDYGDTEDFLDPDEIAACEGKTQIYWEHLLEYEQTQLRDVYASKMEELQPGWKALYEKTKVHRMFEAEISALEGGWLCSIDGWFESWTGDDIPRKDHSGWPIVKEDEMTWAAEEALLVYQRRCGIDDLDEVDSGSDGEDENGDMDGAEQEVYDRDDPDIVAGRKEEHGAGGTKDLMSLVDLNSR